MPQIFRSTRSKLTIWYSSILLSALLAFSLAAYFNTKRVLEENLDRSLRREVHWMHEFVAPKGKPARSLNRTQLKSHVPAQDEAAPDLAGEYAEEESGEVWDQIYQHTLLSTKNLIIQVERASGKPIFRSSNLGDDTLAVGQFPPDEIALFTFQDPRWKTLRCAALRDKSFRIAVAYPPAELEEILGNLFSIYLILIPAAFGAAIAGGWFLARKSLKPVDEIISAAREINARNLDRMLPTRDVDDEIGRLSTTFNQTFRRLHQSFEQAKQFSLDASHELRTPLTIMRGEIEIALRSDKKRDEYRRVLASCLEELLRLTSIVDNLLLLSKSDFDQADIRAEDVDLEELLQEIREDAEIMAVPKGIQVAFEETAKPRIIGDPLRMRQLILNLVDNAMKFTPAGGKVTLALGEQDGHAVVSVSDTGIGIRPADQEKIFDRFYRVDKGRSRELGGSGLGLSIAKWIAEAHGGRIFVTSKEGCGSAFTVILPLEGSPKLKKF
jgi:heavy metal sensor kinase